MSSRFSLAGARRARTLSDVDKTDHGLPPSSVIICTRERPELVSDAVRSIAERVPRRRDRCRRPEQGRTPHSPARLAWVVRPHLRSFAPRGSRVRAEGVAAARTDILVFGDDDVLATEAGRPASSSRS
jgi:hypothetical protein